MFKNFNVATGILALLLFGYAQHQGWNLFDNVANPGKGGTGRSRVFQKLDGCNRPPHPHPRHPGRWPHPNRGPRSRSGSWTVG